VSEDDGSNRRSPGMVALPYIGVGRGAGPAGEGIPGGGLPGPARPETACAISAGTNSLSLPSVSPKAFVSVPIAFIIASPCGVCGWNVWSAWVNFLTTTCTSARPPAKLPSLGLGVIIGAPAGPGAAPGPGGFAAPANACAICGGTLMYEFLQPKEFESQQINKKAARS